MPTVSAAFGLGKSQHELDFVNVSLERDNRLFIDPFAITHQRDRWSQNAARCIRTYFQELVNHIRRNEDAAALELLSHLREPNETRLGYSRRRPKGAGVGPTQAREIFDALSASTAVRTGFITALEECELMVPGISHDKISDLTTNLIRNDLIEYTTSQCDLHSIPMEEVPIPPCFNTHEMRWEARYTRLPVYRRKPVLLVPKAIVRYTPAYESDQYYRRYVLEFLRAQELANPQSQLVRLIKSTQTLRVYTKDLKDTFPRSKEFLLEFSKRNPEVLARYREELTLMERSTSQLDAQVSENETVIATALSDVLRGTPAGDDHATAYHRLMIGIVELIFYPQLVHPRKEVEINEGRKRIDIVMDNAAQTGTFFTLPNIRQVPTSFIYIECKNYGREVGNPELDQLAGRFNVNTGRVGFLCCRTFRNRALFVRRCRDTFQAGSGVIVPLDDNTVVRLLELIERGERASIDRAIGDLVNEIMLN